MSLFAYQDEGAEWLGDRSCGFLADVMGLGKTVQAIEAVNRSPWIGRHTVVCPAFLVTNWERETAKWARRGWDQTVLSYEIAARDGLPLADAYTFDEAHYLKNPESARTQALLGLWDNGLDLSNPLRSATHLWPLSGTPTPNHPGEVWTWLRAFGVIDMPYPAFLLRYCRVRMTEWGMKPLALKKGAGPEIKALLGPWFKMRTLKVLGRETVPWGELFLAADVDSSDMLSFGPVDDYEFGLDDTGDNDCDPRVDPRENFAFAQLLRMLGEAKAKPLATVLADEIKQTGEKVVVFSWHKSVMAKIAAELAARGIESVTVDGSTPMEKRQAHVDRFQNDPDLKVFNGQILAAGTGLTLTAAHRLTFAELSVVPGHNAQAAMRIDRIGQTKPCLIRVASVGDTLDEARNRILARKTQMITQTWS